MTNNASNEPVQSLSGAEWEVMKVIWERGPSAARDVYAALPEEVNWASKTVKTLLSRLVAKGALDYEQIGNSYLYRAVVERSQMTRHEVRGVLGRVMGAAVSPVLANFIEEAELSDKEIGQLKKLLDSKRRELRAAPKKGK
ncbi:MAG: BlaI/MecI/CopY family transcriptional regulator [Planctomycetales bacterium]|nr:BlaI/MecI/CopY family transcriptional regulator [Planctomycetales bacterium]